VRCALTDFGLPGKPEKLIAKIGLNEILHPTGSSPEEIVHAELARRVTSEEWVWLTRIGKLPGRETGHVKENHFGFVLSR
jgi:hypothetical protein